MCGGRDQEPKGHLQQEPVVSETRFVIDALAGYTLVEVACVSVPGLTALIAS